MNIIQKAVNWLSTGVDRKMHEAIFQYIGAGGTILPPNNETYLEQGYKGNLYVNMCVNYILRNAVNVPWVLKRELKDGSYQQINDHPLYDLIERPNSLYSFKEYLEQSLGYLLLTGNSITYKVATGANKERVKEIYYLPVNLMQIISSGSWTDPIRDYEFTIYKGVKFDAREIVHCRLPNFEWELGQNLYGQSPLRAALNSLQASNDTFKAIKSTAANQGAKGIMMFDAAANGVGSSAPTAEQIQNLKRELNKQISGSDNTGAVRILAKMFKYQQLGMSARDMELIAMHKIAKTDICNVFGLSSLLFNDHESSTYNNINEVKKSSWNDAIKPYLERLIEQFNIDIVKPYGSDLAFYPDYSNIDVLQSDKKEMVEWLSKAYWISTQRKQELMGEKAEPSLDPYYIPSNLIPSDEAASTVRNEFGDFES